MLAAIFKNIIDVRIKNNNNLQFALVSRRDPIEKIITTVAAAYQTKDHDGPKNNMNRFQ